MIMLLVVYVYWPQMQLKNGVYLNKQSGRRKSKVGKPKKNYQLITFCHLFTNLNISWKYSTLFTIGDRWREILLQASYFILHNNLSASFIFISFNNNNKKAKHVSLRRNRQIIFLNFEILPSSKADNKAKTSCVLTSWILQMPFWSAILGKDVKYHVKWEYVFCTIVPSSSLSIHRPKLFVNLLRWSLFLLQLSTVFSVIPLTLFPFFTLVILNILIYRGVKECIALRVHCKKIWIYVPIPRKRNCAASIPNFRIPVSVSDLYIFPRSAHLFSCSRIGADRSEEYIKSLTETWM